MEDINLEYWKIYIYFIYIMRRIPQQKSETKPDNQLNEKLIDAASRHNLQEVRALVEQGADVNYVRYTGGDAWYRGNSNTALYQAVHTKF